MEIVKFKWKKETPEDFIVKEIAEYPIIDNGTHYLYLLAKRNLTTKELARKLNFSYAGMKDKLALTFQFISFQDFKGNFIRENMDSQSWFILKFIGQIGRKIKIGQLKGNRFGIKINDLKINYRQQFINYYDIQRIHTNRVKGKNLLKKLSVENKRKLTWRENIYIDGYLGYLWNKSFEGFLKENFNGNYIEEKGEPFFIVNRKDEIINLPKFWTILGYKKKLLESENYYKQLLKEEGFELNDFLSLMKKLRIKGDYRMSYINVRNFKQVNDRIFFFLPKGAYATMYLKHLQI